MDKKELTSTGRGGRAVKSLCQIQVETHWKTRVQIPAWDYDINRSEVEILCRYS